jgi:hypothetical protein
MLRNALNRIFYDAAAGGGGGGAAAPAAPAAAAPAGAPAPAAGAPAAAKPPAPPAGDGTIANGGAGTIKPPAAPGAVTEVKAADLKLPDGTLLDPQATERIAAFAREQGLSTVQAQSVVERESVFLGALAEQQNKDLAEKAGAWLQLAKDDAEIGRDKFNESAELAKRFIERNASPQLKATLDETGLGNHPELIRMLVKAEKRNREDTLEVDGTPTPHPKDKSQFKTREQRLFQRTKPPDQK